MAIMGSSRLPQLFHYSILPLLFFANLILGADPYFQARCATTPGYYTTNSTYQANLNTIFSQLTPPVDFNYGFYNLSAGQNTNQVNAIALCRGDRNQEDCNTCLSETVSELKRLCPFNKEAVGWSELCMLRYANRQIYGKEETSPGACLLNTGDVGANVDRFNEVLDELLNNLSSRASAEGYLRKYAADNSTVGVFQMVYAQVQCSPELSEGECGDCLNVAKYGIGSCCLGKMGCRILRPSCFLRYETYPFVQTPVPVLSPTPSATSSPSAASSPPRATGDRLKDVVLAKQDHPKKHKTRFDSYIRD